MSDSDWIDLIFFYTPHLIGFIEIIGMIYGNQMICTRYAAIDRGAEKVIGIL